MGEIKLSKHLITKQFAKRIVESVGAGLRHNRRAVVIGAAVCLVLTGALWGGTQREISVRKEDARNSAVKEASALAEAYAIQLSRSVEQIDQITLNLKHYWQKTRGAVDLQEQLRQGLYPSASHIYVTIVSPDGKPVTSTHKLTKDSPSVADRSHFLDHKNNPFIGLRISEPMAGIQTRRPVILFSRRLDKANGEFDGIVVVAVEPVFLASFNGAAELGRCDFMSVKRSDGTLLASVGGTTGIEGKPADYLKGHFRSPPVFDAKAGSEWMPDARFATSESHIVAWETVRNYPLVSIAGFAEKEILQPLDAIERDYRNIASIGSVLLFSFTLIGMYFSSRLAWKKHQAEEVKNAYRLATDSAREGFFMVRAMYGEEGKKGGITDFLVEDCNENGARYFGSTRARLLGAKFSDFPMGDYLQEVLSVYRLAMETGFYEDDFKTPSGSPLEVTWVHRRLVRSGDGLAVTMRDISDIKANEEALSRLANADAVTSLPNRHWLMNYLPLAVERARSDNTVLALLFVDLDDFKNINDTQGHAAGDELLKAVALRLKSLICPQDSIVRLGGDEFTLILEQQVDNDDVARVAERIVKSLREPFLLADQSSHLVHASIGISMFPEHGGDGLTLLKHADIAMYAAKTNGKGQYRFFQPQLSAKLVARLNIEQALRHAIECDEFVLYYQPRVGTTTGELRGVEALVRWMHPERGLVPPNEFIPVAEETGLIVPLGELVVRKVCVQLAQWKGQQLPVVPVSINVSPRQFNDGRLSALFASSMEKYGIGASLIEIEITESCMLGEDHAVTAELAAIERLGMKLHVDDFGTGYSSLSQLKRLDVDGLKIDKAFTSQLGSSKEDEAFFRAMLSMAHALDMSVTAEGVETLEQLHILQRLSCDEVQGYLIAKPLPASQIPAVMLQRFLLSAAEK
jgi:diguanylate cyclase (GGDEF)-like protein